MLLPTPDRDARFTPTIVAGRSTLHRQSRVGLGGCCSNGATRKDGGRRTRLRGLGRYVRFATTTVARCRMLTWHRDSHESGWGDVAATEGRGRMEEGVRCYRDVTRMRFAPKIDMRRTGGGLQPLAFGCITATSGNFPYQSSQERRFKRAGVGLLEAHCPHYG